VKRACGTSAIRLRDYANLQKHRSGACLLDNEVVVATTQAAVSGDHRQQNLLHWTNLDERRVHVLDTQPLVDSKEHL
jgi:hypothetical protein